MEMIMHHRQRKSLASLPAILEWTLGTSPGSWWKEIQNNCGGKEGRFLKTSTENERVILTLCETRRREDPPAPHSRSWLWLSAGCQGWTSAAGLCTAPLSPYWIPAVCDIIIIAEVSWEGIKSFLVYLVLVFDCLFGCFAQLHQCNTNQNFDWQ